MDGERRGSVGLGADAQRRGDVDGVADISIDPDFAAVVESSNYQVFLTEYDDHRALYVTDRTPCGFRVRSKSSAASGS